MTLVTLRATKIRRMGGVTFIQAYAWQPLTDFKAEPETYMLERQTTLEYDTLIHEICPGAILHGQTLSKDVRGRYPLHIRQIWRPSAFPKKYPTAPIQDKAIRYSNPVLANLSDRRRLKVLVHRSEIQRAVQDSLHRMGFRRISTPVLQQHPQGGGAKPFHTRAHYNQKNYCLRSSHEFPGKRLLIMGLDRVYVWGPSFRNEDLGRQHCFEFDSLECYYTISKTQGFSSLLSLVEALYTGAFVRIHGHSMLGPQDLSQPWPVVQWRDLAGGDLSPDHLDRIERIIKADPASLNLPPAFHLAGLPQSSQPLAVSVDGFALGFESFIRGVEITTCYVQQTDPAQIRRKWDLEDPARVNPEFLLHLSYGLPSCAGLGLGIDRMVYTILKEGSHEIHNIRDVRSFPCL